jgi:hypothetical protein
MCTAGLLLPWRWCGRGVDGMQPPEFLNDGVPSGGVRTGSPLCGWWPVPNDPVLLALALIGVVAVIAHAMGPWECRDDPGKEATMSQSLITG